MWNEIKRVLVTVAVLSLSGCPYSEDAGEDSEVGANDMCEGVEAWSDAEVCFDAEGVPQESAYPCPEDLADCYDLFEPGNECSPGKLVARFTVVNPGGTDVCPGTQDGDLGLAGCVFYGGAVATLAYCCNGYIANRANAIVDSRSLECCAKALAAPGEEEALFAALGTSGVYDSGLDVSQWLPDLSAADVVCAAMHFSTGEQTNEYVAESPGAFVTYHEATVLQVGAQRILHCAFDSPPLSDDPVGIRNLGLVPDSDWPPGGGAGCYSIQEAAYPW